MRGLVSLGSWVRIALYCGGRVAVPGRGGERWGVVYWGIFDWVALSALGDLRLAVDQEEGEGVALSAHYTQCVSHLPQ